MLHIEEAPKQGCSKPVIITASDGITYVLKNNMVPSTNELVPSNQDAEFFQETLVSKIATKLHVPTPDYAVITIDSDTLEIFPALRWQYKFRVGKYFATKRLPNIGNDLVDIWNLAIKNDQPYSIRGWHKIFANVTNKEVIPTIICLDFYTLNLDRFTNTGNLLFQYKPDGKWIVSIDYGLCFSTPFWNSFTVNNTVNRKSDILNLNNPKTNPEICNSYSANMMQWFLSASLQHGQLKKWKYGVIFDSLQREINFTNQNPFDAPISNIEALTDAFIISSIGSIPSEWVSGGSTQKEAYAGFLIRQKSLIKPFIEYNISQNMFTNYAGGKIEWQKDKSMSSR